MDYSVRRLADPRGEESEFYKVPKSHVQRSLGATGEQNGSAAISENPTSRKPDEFEIQQADLKDLVEIWLPLWSEARHIPADFYSAREVWTTPQLKDQRILTVGGGKKLQPKPSGCPKKLVNFL